jgi:hypothetical protein
MRFSAEIWRRSEHLQALGNFSKLIREKSPIRRQRVKGFSIYVYSAIQYHPETACSRFVSGLFDLQTYRLLLSS